MMWHVAPELTVSIALMVAGATRIVSHVLDEGLIEDFAGAATLVVSFTAALSGGFLFWRYAIHSGLETQSSVIADLQEERDSCRNESDRLREQVEAQLELIDDLRAVVRELRDDTG